MADKDWDEENSALHKKKIALQDELLSKLAISFGTTTLSIRTKQDRLNQIIKNNGNQLPLEEIATHEEYTDHMMKKITFASLIEYGKQVVDAAQLNFKKQVEEKLANEMIVGPIRHIMEIQVDEMELRCNEYKKFVENAPMIHMLDSLKSTEFETNNVTKK